MAHELEAMEAEANYRPSPQSIDPTTSGSFSSHSAYPVTSPLHTTAPAPIQTSASFGVASASGGLPDRAARQESGSARE
jgi:hypothetical protein